MAHAKELTEEVWRIVKSPYAVSLKPLHDVLQNVSKHELEYWAYGNGCQIPALAAAVLEGLSLWPYTLEIIQELAAIAAFRDAILEQQPTLLTALLEKANAQDHAPFPYTSTCVSLLSYPLPIRYSMPASLPAFVLKLLKKAISTPCASTVRPIYSVINGVGAGVLNILPLKTVTQLQEQLIALLRSLVDHSASLLCLAIFATIRQTTGVASPRNETFSSSPPDACGGTSPLADLDKFESAKDFFTAKRAAKTLDLVVLQLILACSSSSGMTSPQATEIVRLSKIVIDAVDFSEKRDWITKNATKVRKAHEKVLRQGIDPVLQLAGFDTLASLDGIDSAPEETVAAFQLALMKSRIPFGLERVVGIYVSRFSAAFIQDQLLRTLWVATEQCNYGSAVMSEVKLARELIRGFAKGAMMSERTGQAVLEALSLDSFRPPLNKLTEIDFPCLTSTHHSCFESCPSKVEEVRGILRHELCAFLLRCAMYRDPHGIGFDQSLMAHLFARIETPLCLSPPCELLSQWQISNIPSLSIVEVQSTPRQSSSTTTWRDLLGEELMQEAAVGHKKLVHVMNQVCLDLEQRCNNAEQPLLEEQAKSLDLKGRLEELESTSVRIRAEARERTLVIDTLESEKVQLADQLRETDEHLQETSAGLEQAFVELNEAKSSLERLKEENLQNTAMLLTKEDIIEEKSLRITSLNEKCKNLEDRVVTLEAAVTLTEETVSELSSSVESRRNDTDNLRQICAKQKADLDRLSCVEKKLSDEVDSLKLQVQETETSHKRDTDKFLGLISSSEKLIQDLQQTHKADLASKAAEIHEEKASHEQAISELKIAMEKDREDAENLLTGKGSKIQELEGKIHKLKLEREQRAREFAQAQDLSSKLMKVMGMQPSDRPSNTSLTRAPDRDTIQQQLYPRSEAGEGQSQDMPNSSSSSSSSRSGPTPKRCRTERRYDTTSNRRKTISFDAPVTADTPYNYKLTRRPLGLLEPATQTGGISRQMSSNPTYAKVHSPYRTDTKDEFPFGGAEEIEEFSFDENHIFTSTASQQMDRAESSPNRGFYDETTTDSS